jgi:hypothetical protein
LRLGLFFPQTSLMGMEKENLGKYSVPLFEKEGLGEIC